MRLLFVITRGDILGGAQGYVRDLAHRFADDGHELLVATGASGVMTADLETAGIAVGQVPGLLREIHPIHDPRSVVTLARTIRSFQPDLVSTHSSKAGIVGRLASRIAGVPCIHTANGWAFNPAEPQPKRLIYRVLERATAPLTAKIICVSDAGRDLAISAGISADCLVTIHNGIPDLPARFHATPGGGDPVRVAFVARFAIPKDHRTLLQAASQVPGLHVDLIGDGPGEADVRALVADFGFGDRVHFLGGRHDVAELLARSQIFALCTRSEGFPLSTLEAMRAGLPVVVSNVGGAPEAVVDGESGFVVTNNDVEGWRQRLAMLAGDGALRARIGAAARARFEAKFTLERMYAATLQVYREAARPAVERTREVAQSS